MHTETHCISCGISASQQAANKQNAVSSWTSCTESSLKGIHRPVSPLCLVFGSAPFAFYVWSGHVPDLLGFCGWFVGVLVLLVPLLSLVRLISSHPSFEIHHGDLCLSAHTAPLPVQKKNFDCQFLDHLALGFSP